MFFLSFEGYHKFNSSTDCFTLLNLMSDYLMENFYRKEVI